MADQFGPEYFFERLIKKYQGWLYLILERKFWDQPFIDNVVQDTFKTVFEAIQKGELQKSEATPAFLRNTAFDIADGYLNNDKHPAVGLDHLANTKSNLYNNVDKNKLHAYVQQVVEKMPDERNRQLLVLLYCEGEDKAGICKRLNITPEHFDQVTYLAKQQLKTLLDKNE